MTSPAEVSVEAAEQDRMVQRDVAALAAFVHGRRPDWDEPGIAAVLRELGARLPATVVAIAMLKAARDPANDTPAALLHRNNRAWDDEAYPPCPTHGSRAVRTDGTCGGCHADAKQGTTVATFVRHPPTEAARRARAQLRHHG